MVLDDYSAVDALDTVGFPTLKKNHRARRKRTAAQLKIVYEAANINAHVGKEGGDSVSADAQSAGEVDVSAEVKGALETEPAVAIQDNIDAHAASDAAEEAATEEAVAEESAAEEPAAEEAAAEEAVAKEAISDEAVSEESAAKEAAAEETAAKEAAAEETAAEETAAEEAAAEEPKEVEKPALEPASAKIFPEEALVPAVFFIPHAVHETYFPYLVLEADNGRALTLSEDHFLVANGSPTRAANVRVGDAVTTRDGPARVSAIKSVNERGAFNPRRHASGSLEVNGVHALCASGSFMDVLLPETAVPPFWDVALAPVQWLAALTPTKWDRFHRSVRKLGEHDMCDNLGWAIKTYLLA